jgi:hypothetical protein
MPGSLFRHSILVALAFCAFCGVLPGASYKTGIGTSLCPVRTNLACRTFGWGHERYLASFSGIAPMYSFSSRLGPRLTGLQSSRRSASSQIDRFWRDHVQQRYGKRGGAPSGFALSKIVLAQRVRTPWHAGASGDTGSDVKNMFAQVFSPCRCFERRVYHNPAQRRHSDIPLYLGFAAANSGVATRR